MGIKEGGKLAIVAGAGPMGLGALTYALHCDRKPGLVVADINQDRLDRAEHLFPPAEIKAETGIDLVFANNGKMDDPVAVLREISGGTGFDDVLCYAPVAAVVTLSSAILGRDGCLNFFAGPTDKHLSAEMNFCEDHYGSTHVMGPPVATPQTRSSPSSSPLPAASTRPSWSPTSAAWTPRPRPRSTSRRYRAARSSSTPTSRCR